MTAITRRIIAVVFLVTFASGAALAKDEHRKINWSWRLYGGSSGNFESAQAVIDALNARSEQLYAACTAGTCNGTCTRVTHTPPINPNPNAMINGQWTWLMTSGATYTTYTTACGANPANGPTSSFANGDQRISGVAVSYRLVRSGL